MRLDGIFEYYFDIKKNFFRYMLYILNIFFLIKILNNILSIENLFIVF